MALYEIYTAQDLRRFRDEVNDGNYNLNAILMNDIDLQGNDLDQWVPIAINTYASFSGTFDGNGYTISGLYINRSTILDEYGEPDYNIDNLAFISSAKDAVIKNLILEGYILGGWGGVAGFVAQLGSCKIINCINRVVLTGPEWVYYIGGLAVVAYDAEIINCINEADIGRNDTYSASAGGIVCECSSGYIINCINKGNIYGVESAGIAYSTGICTINNCVNEGNIFGTGSCGIVSNLYLYHYNEDTHNIITNCVNKGIITGDRYVSGIVDCVTSNLELKNCVNEGTINCESNYGSIFRTLYDADYTQNNYYLDTSCNQAGVYKNNNSVIISIPDSITPYTEGNAPTVSALVDTMYVEANSLRVKLYPYYNPSISTVEFDDWDISNDKVAKIVNDTIVLKKNGTFELDYNTSFTAKNGNIDLGTINIVNKFIKVINLPSNLAPVKKSVKKSFSRYILDGNTLNYNEYQPDAITSKNNVRIGRVWPVSNLSHFLVNDNNYFFCNSNNKINAYTNTGVLYYTTEKEYPNIENMIISMGNNIYIKYDTNKLDHLVILGNMLDLIWTIENDDFGSSITSDDNYIYINSISNSAHIYVINPRLVNEGDYIDRIITITGFSAEYDSNEHKTIKEIKCYNNYMFCLYGTDNDTSPSYICKIDLNNDDIIFNVMVSDDYTTVTSNLYIINNITYFAKHNIVYKMNLNQIIASLEVFSVKCDIVKIDKIDDNRLFVMTNDNRVAIIDISGEYSNDLGLIIFTYDDSENTDKILLDVEIDKKDKNFYFVYLNSIEKVYPSLMISPYGIIGSPCYKFDGGSSYIEFRTMPMNNNNFSTSVSFKPTKINNSKSVLFGGGDNYNWSSICWSDYLNIFCAITKNDNITSIMPDDGSENWYTTNTRTLPIADWNSICWDNVYNLFYTISTDNKFAYSSDGLNWILIDNIPNSGLWNKVYYAEVINNTYILQKNSDKLLYAMNVSSTWGEITLPIVSDWKDIVYRNSDKMLVLVNGTNKIYTVKRHSVFNSIVVGENANWTNVCYSKELDLFVLIAKDSNDIAYSSNGLIWTLRKLPYADSWSTIIYDEFNFNRFFIFANDSNKYISSSNLIDWKIVDNELNQNYNITSVSAGNKMICALINDADLSLKIMSGSDIIINNKYQKTLTNVFNRNVTKSTFQLYFDGNDNFMYVLYGNYKFKCYFKIDSSKIDNWYNITTIVNNNKIKVYSNSILIGNFDIDDDIDVYNYTMNDIENDKYYFIMPDLDTFSNIYTFRIGNSVFNNNYNNSLYGYVNDFILFNYIITEKEIDEISKIKVLHCRFNYDFKDPIYKNIIHDISCYKHDLTGTADYSSTEEAFKFDDYVNVNVAKNNFYFINDKFTLSFWYKNEIDNNLGSKILMSNYKNKDPYMLLLADQFKPTTDLPIQLVQSKYEVREISLLLETTKWVNNDGYYDYIVSNEHVDENTVIDILPNIYISDYEFDSLLETDLMGYSQSEGTFTLRCYGIKPAIDIPVRVLIRTWVPTSMSLQYITLSANNWNNNLYTVYIPGIKNTDTIEMIIDNEPTYKQYNAIMAADLKGYSQSNNLFTIKSNGIIPTIDVPILFYINSNEAKISETILDRNYWLGTETPFNYRITLDDPNDNFVNILPSNYITSEELNILKTAGIRDGGLFGTEISGWMITYMPTEEDPEKYSIYFVMIEGNGRITKVNCVKDDANINYENWNNFVISYNNGIFNTYINGIPQRVENYKNYIDSSNLIIGANPNMINLANIGMVYGSYYMKDVRVFHEALNNNYIQELVNRGNMLNSSGSLYTEKISENYDNVDISKEGLKVKTITEYTDTDPDSVYDYDILINLQHGINNNEVLLKDEIVEKL